jgi:hypothetical protein
MAYDSYRQRIVMFGGLEVFPVNRESDGTWEWDGTTWLERFPTLRPPARIRHELVFDSARRQIVLFGGGAFGSSPFGDTWTYGTTAPASHSPYGAGCLGSAGTPDIALAPGREPWIGDSLELAITRLPPGQPAALNLGFSRTSWQGLALPFPLGAIGMPGCDLLVGPDLTCPLANPAGSATFPLRIPFDPRYIGLPFFDQALVLDPGANALGVIVSNGGAGKVGAR